MPGKEIVLFSSPLGFGKFFKQKISRRGFQKSRQSCFGYWRLWELAQGRLYPDEIVSGRRPRIQNNNLLAQVQLVHMKNELFPYAPGTKLPIPIKVGL